MTTVSLPHASLTIPLALALTSVGAAPSLAQLSSLPGVGSVTGQTTLINPPLNATLNPFTTSGGAVVPPLESDVTAFLWLEQTDFNLTSNLLADITVPGFYNQQSQLPAANGTIAAGTKINSYYLYTNAVGTQPLGPTNPTYTGVINFEEEIIGLFTTAANVTLSGDIFELPGTIYLPGNAQGLGTTLSPLRDQLNLSADLKQLAFTFTTGPASDQIRILTKAATPFVSTPEPSNLVGLGLIGLGVFFKGRLTKKKQAPKDA
ncbi:MAG: hypothetical protein EWV75_18060 [Microcystis wesenbergii Mw_QC_S_20081001_S30D]|jgi:hypothetical protein|uniref:PEP-CTERM sorting domain-containing protein n=1 Tax=Microcystis wesenbergii Mw_QC_S_20081001_S30D TaxID=2486245 RepID=A0A552JDV7_9CHRO|nr:MAG: hypothetical protein EWV75_18060 [Microcystis wesenbergii Mw_QC_S_20081001_S30D]TRU95901.1 MAG: hypothetical protein EWV74_19660 [Microcystis wesenbergii Mw_QC_S_20081001_S30]TRV04117.1 MAG: hypothetical protein EWV73_03445 [Microcystis wesenbergii Mw_QC_B_20070930_S4D]TRV08389.1 MAG: hypothetical protein EWV89_20755 [Microcystis wesenbergii Mw_QC_B_20070930_S4]